MGYYSVVENFKAEPVKLKDDITVEYLLETLDSKAGQGSFNPPSEQLEAFFALEIDDSYLTMEPQEEDAKAYSLREALVELIRTVRRFKADDSDGLIFSFELYGEGVPDFTLFESNGETLIQTGGRIVYDVDRKTFS